MVTYAMETLYFIAFRKLSNRQTTAWLWVYRRLAAAREIAKHARRGNWGAAWRYVRIL